MKMNNNLKKIVFYIFVIIVDILIVKKLSQWHYADGFARDAGIYIETIYQYISWVLLLTGILLLVLLCISSVTASKKFKAITLCIFILFSSSSMIWIFTMKPYSYDSVGLSNVSEIAGDITEITLEQFKQALDKDESGVYYIGRDDCHDCEVIYPYLLDFCQNKHLNIEYYNTKKDRDNKTEELHILLEELSIDVVPYVLILENGDVTKRFYGNYLLDDLSEYYQ